MSTRSNIVKAFIGGIAAGAIIGVLVAPQSGAKTRKKIVKKAKASKESFNQMVEDGKNSWFEAKDTLTTKAGVAADEVDNFVRHILEKGKNWWAGAQADAEDMADDAEEFVDEAVSEGKKTARKVANEASNGAAKMKKQMS